MVKLFIPLLLIGLCIFSDLYIFLRYINPKLGTVNCSLGSAAFTKRKARLKELSTVNCQLSTILKWAWWLPLLILLCMLIKFLFFNEGFEREYNNTNIFLLLMGLFCIPKILFCILSLIPKVGEYIGIAVALAVIYIILYGITLGFSKLEVRHITFESERVPTSFDGYKIVQFSDAHTGVFRGRYAHLLRESIDTINAQQPDLVCFVGDIENFSPHELDSHKTAYSAIRAQDGVMTIMGNHDYSTYLHLPSEEEAAMVQRTRDMQRSFGWDMLVNEHRIIRHGNDSIYVIGEENWGFPPFPQYGDIRKAIAGTPYEATSNIATKRDTENSTNSRLTPLSIVLSHDPNAWRAHIMPVMRPDITLSGHTHGTQFSIFGWSPASMAYKEWGKTYYYNDNDDYCKNSPCLLSVSTGLGGNFPFRFNMPREIVVITLKTTKATKK